MVLVQTLVHLVQLVRLLSHRAKLGVLEERLEISSAGTVNVGKLQSPKGRRRSSSVIRVAPSS
jgi:hypothetical protein